MNKVLVYSRNSVIVDGVKNILRPFSDSILAEFTSTLEESVQFLNYEYPELVILDFTVEEEMDSMYQFIHTMKNDPWLHYSGVVIVYANKSESELLEKIEGTNVVGSMERREISLRLPSVIKIFSRNNNLIFQRELQQSLMKNITGEFILDNDPFEANVYASILSNYLYYSNYIRLNQRDRIKLVFIELIQNAIEHGNCNISYEEKTRLLMDGQGIMEIIENRNKDPEIAHRKVYLSYRIHEDISSFSIRDEGTGFDWRKHLNNTKEKNEKAHGRGITITTQIVQNFRYNDSGNQVSFEIPHETDHSNFIPQIFVEKEELSVKSGDFIFREGESSNFLYYIAKGEYEVIAKSGDSIARLTPNDIFIGELAFLLSNRRTATVKAVTDGLLIKVSKSEFVDSIKTYPYYGLFLSRLLARKIDHMNNL